MGETPIAELIILKKQDFEKVCRCCLSQVSVLDLFNLNYDGVLISDILSELLCIQVDAEDRRPKSICETCIVLVIQFYHFKKNIEKTELILSTFIKNHLVAPIKEENVTSAVPEEVPSEDLEPSQGFSESDLDKNENENIQNCEAPSQTETSTDAEIKTENVLDKPAKRKRRQGAGDPKFVNRRYRRAEGPVTCPFCSEVFETASAYYQHRKAKSDGVHRRKHPCAVCGKLYTSNHMAQHLRNHQEKTERCEICSLKLSSRSSYERHRKLHAGVINGICEICGKTFVNPYTLKTHSRIHSKEKPYLCSLCGKEFRYNKTYIFHMRKHAEGKVQTERNEPEMYFCKICSKEYKTKYSYQYHMESHSGIQFPCELCGKSFARKGGLAIHVQKHHTDTGETASKITYNCTHCTMVFKKRSHYEGHLKSLKDRNISAVGIPETEFKCPVCHKCYATKSSLHNHMGLHDATKFLCSECGKTFNSKTALNLHSVAHTGIKRFSCPFCDKKFSSSGGRRTHIFGHTGERPYVCHICSKGFTQGPKLKIHMRTHTGERPYVCPHCSKAFPTKTYLVIHIRSHTGETPYVCDVCSKGFYHSSSLTKHRQTHFKRIQIKDELEVQLCQEALD